jgi:hypothetical protein
MPACLTHRDDDPLALGGSWSAHETGEPASFWLLAAVEAATALILGALAWAVFA